MIFIMMLNFFFAKQSEQIAACKMLLQDCIVIIGAIQHLIPG
jgi:hypothetical protein